MTVRAITDASGNIATVFTVPQSAPAGVQTLEIAIGGVTRRTSFEIIGPPSTLAPKPTPTLSPTPTIRAIPTPRPTSTPLPRPIPQPTATILPTPTPVRVFGQAYIDAGLARIRDFIPFYLDTSNIGQVCLELRQLINSVNVSGAAKSIDYYVNELAGEYWSPSGNAYSVRIFQGLPPPGQIISSQLSELCPG